MILEIDNEFSRIVIPHSVLNGKRELLCPGRPVHVFGELKEHKGGTWHVAKEFHLRGRMH